MMVSFRYIKLMVLLTLFMNGRGLLASNMKGADTPQKTYLSSYAQSKPAEVGDTIHYKFQVENLSDKKETFVLEVYKPRELACNTKLWQMNVKLLPGATQEVLLDVCMSERIPVGAYEDCMIIAKVEGGREVDRLKFSTSRTKPHPFLLATPSILNESADKLKRYEWAKTTLMVC